MGVTLPSEYGVGQVILPQLYYVRPIVAAAAAAAADDGDQAGRVAWGITSLTGTIVITEPVLFGPSA